LSFAKWEPLRQKPKIILPYSLRKNKQFTGEVYHWLFWGAFFGAFLAGILVCFDITFRFDTKSAKEEMKI